VSDPDLITLEVSEGNKANITPGIYVHVDSLAFWLQARQLKKSARELHAQAVSGEILGDSTKVEFASHYVCD